MSLLFLVFLLDETRPLSPRQAWIVDKDHTGALQIPARFATSACFVLKARVGSCSILAGYLIVVLKHWSVSFFSGLSKR